MALASQRLAKRAQAVRRVGHAVQQQHGAFGGRAAIGRGAIGGAVRRPFERTIPVRLPREGIDATAANVAHQLGPGRHVLMVVERLPKLLEKLRLERDVGVEACDVFHVGGVFAAQELGVPGLEQIAARRESDVKRDATDDDAAEHPQHANQPAQRRPADRIEQR